MYTENPIKHGSIIKIVAIKLQKKFDALKTQLASKFATECILKPCDIPKG